MGTTINLANIALGFDASKIQKGVDLSAGEIRKLNSAFQSSISGVDRYNQEMQVLDKARKTGALTAQRVVEIEATLAAKYGILAHAERERIEKEKRLSDELQLGLSLRKQVATAEERNAESTKEYNRYLEKGIIDLQTYNRLLDKMHAKPQVESKNPFAWVASARGSLTEINSALEIGRKAFYAFQAVITPVFDEMDRVDEITDKAHKLGLGFAELNTIQMSLAETSGLGADDIGKAMQKLTIGLTEARTTGKGAHAEALAVLGLSGDSLAGKSQTQQFATIADAMGTITSHAERLKLSFDLFGKSGADLVSSLSEGGDKLREMESFANMVGLNLSDAQAEGIGAANDAMGRLQQATEGWLTQLTAGVAPVFGIIATDMMAIVGGAGEMKSQFEGFGEGLAKSYGLTKDLFEIPGNFVAGIASGKSAPQAMAGMFGEDEGKKAVQRVIDARKQAEEDATQAKLKREQDHALKMKQILDDAEKERADKEAAREKQIQDEKDLRERERQERIKKDLIRDAVMDFEKLKSDVKNENNNPNNIAAAVAPTLRAGSVEAYRFLMNQRNEAAEIAMKQADIAEQQLVVQQQQLEAFQNSQMIGIAGRTA
jgi:hypothetical protein